jgi:dTDP-4-amino-4,6-dideoxy-D-galactose acyltransferase
MDELESAFNARRSTLFYYSPYNFIRAIDIEKQTKYFVEDKLFSFKKKDNHFIYQTNVEGQEFFFLYELMPWDSTYFKLPTYKLYSALFTTASLLLLTQAANNFKNFLFKDEKRYCFIDIPSEDIY